MPLKSGSEKGFSESENRKNSHGNLSLSLASVFEVSISRTIFFLSPLGSLIDILCELSTRKTSFGIISFFVTILSTGSSKANIIVAIAIKRNTPMIIRADLGESGIVVLYTRYEPTAPVIKATKSASLCGSLNAISQRVLSMIAFHGGFILRLALLGVRFASRQVALQFQSFRNPHQDHSCLRPALTIWCLCIQRVAEHWEETFL